MEGVLCISEFPLKRVVEGLMEDKKGTLPQKANRKQGQRRRNQSKKGKGKKGGAGLSDALFPSFIDKLKFMAVRWMGKRQDCNTGVFSPPCSKFWKGGGGGRVRTRKKKRKQFV